MTSSSVDWRNRWGRNWITSVRNQGGSQNCWAFGTTALYEAMIRIEHSLWTRRSEADLARGAGKQAWDLGNFGEATIFVERYGLADPDCFPWSEWATLYTAKEGGAQLSATPLSTTSDRTGRTMRVAAGATTTYTAVSDKKQWIDLTGPMAVMINPPGDFDAFHGTGVYVAPTTGAGQSHALLVVGYNDDGRFWVIKNSWGTGWGDSGFARVSYDGRDANGNIVQGAGLLETVAFVGLRGTNADPWAKRRLRTGVLIQGGNGALRNNFELFVRVGANIEQWYRENSASGTPWYRAGIVRSSDPWRDTFHDDALDCPAAVQSTFNRNFELIYRSNINTLGQLRHVYYDQAGGLWQDATLFANGTVGIPGFVQSNRGAPGDFEVVVLTRGGQAAHYTKHNSAPWTFQAGQWYLRAWIGSNIWFGGPALVQSNIGVTNLPENGAGQLHYVCTGIDGHMQHWYYTGSGYWSLLGTFGQNVASAPCMIQGTHGAGDEMGRGNFELCVAVGGQIEYWSRSNAPQPGQWTRSAVFGANVRRVISLIQSTYGENLEVIAELGDGRYQHFWLDYWNSDPVWKSGVVITSTPAYVGPFLTAMANPSTVPMGQPVSLTVTSSDAPTGAAVAGQVFINGISTAPTNQQFTYTFTGGENVTVRATAYPEAVVTLNATRQLTVSASPSSVNINESTTMLIASRDAVTGATVSGRVYINGIDSAATNQAFLRTFNGTETVTARATGYVEAVVAMTFVRLLISASPSTIREGRRTSVTVTCTDRSTGALVAGRVWISGVDTAPTNQAFNYTFNGAETLTVRAPGYPEMPVPVQFSTSPF